MSQIWKELYDPIRHRDFMTGYQGPGGVGGLDFPRDNLIDKWVYFVREASFTFQFHSVQQIEEARAYFNQTVHPARRQPGHELEHCWQRWFERLPAGLNGGTKRLKVLRALDEAIKIYQQPNQSARPPLARGQRG